MIVIAALSDLHRDGGRRKQHSAQNDHPGAILWCAESPAYVADVCFCGDDDIFAHLGLLEVCR